ncbi:hypothetical protein [Novosphingobium sp.]|uniref:hypothetical protein n=1 Tax=Novosphingobium sp. TaxID=1874826 RepID=UPI0028AEB037|nr:hypothetical protein [Novosphingobium sp.]
MSNQTMLTEIDGPMLAEAFPAECLPAAVIAGTEVAQRLMLRQWTDRFAVHIGFQSVLIPSRLNFSPDQLIMVETEEVRRFVRALETRSNDGFERQRAARDLLVTMEPWGAPFILSLVGEYVIEILEDIASAITPENEQILGTFITQNEAYWNTIRRRVASYWNVYYRSYPRTKYVGFELVKRLEAAASVCAETSSK